MMTRSIAQVTCLLSFGVLACQSTQQEESPFANGVPRESTVAMSVPGSSVKALTVESGSYALQGQTATWYTVTRDVSTVVNAGAIAVGTLVRLVTDYPPTTVTADTAVWGPWQGPLDPIEWKVTVTRVVAHQYQYKFEGRAKTDQTAAFVTVLSGTHSPGLDAAGNELEGFGSGNFLLDWNARATLPAPDGNVGTASYTYAHTAADAVVNISAQFRQVKDDNHPGQLVDVDYAFMQNPGADGSMDFHYDLPASTTTAGGVAKVKSRWLWSGAGRADVSVAPTTTTLTFTQSECWDTQYLSVYKSTPLSTAATDNYGSESNCVFATAVYSQL